MNLDNLKALAEKGLFLSKKMSPQLLTGVGVVGVVATVVMASRATLKLEEKVADIQEGKETVKTNIEIGGVYPSKKAADRDMMHVYLNGAYQITKLYAPAILVGVASLSCILSAQNIMHKRNAALAAAYKALDTSFKKYRKRVIEEIGEKKELDIWHDFRQEERTDETGKRSKIATVDPNAHSPYARFFDEHSLNWSKTPEYNLTFLRAQQNYANDLLKSRGHVFLNEVYDMLGLPRSQAGQIVGWIYNCDGDNFIDFNIYDLHSDTRRAFVNGLERSILLDFNVDGVVYNMI